MGFRVETNCTAYLGMPLDIGSPCSNARLVHFGRDSLQKVDGVVDTSSREALRLLLVAIRDIRDAGSKASAGCDGTGTCGLGRDLSSSLLGTCFRRSGLLGWCGALLFGKEPRVLRLPRELSLALLLLVLALLT